MQPAGGGGLVGPSPRIFCEIGGPRVILAIENTNKFVIINMQLIYSFADSSIKF